MNILRIGFLLLLTLATGVAAAQHNDGLKTYISAEMTDVSRFLRVALGYRVDLQP